MRARIVLLGTLGAAAMSGDIAAQGRARVMAEWREAVVLRLARGDTLFVNTDSAFAYNRRLQQANRLMPLLVTRLDSLRLQHLATISRKDSIIALLQRRVALADSINRLRDSTVVAFREVARIQQQAWDSLQHRFRSLDSLTHRSVDNTDRALSYAKRVRITSYLTSGLAGGIVGGFGIKSEGQEGFQWTGFAIGAGLGVAINALLQNFLD